MRAQLARPVPSALHLLLVFGGLLVGGFLLALVSSSAPQAAAGLEPAGVYFEPADTPPASRLNVTSDRLVAEGLTVVQNAAQLQAVVAQRHPAAIWLNEAALDQVPHDWLHAQFQRGIVIVGINSTVHDLATAVGADPSWGWTSEWRHPSKPTFVALYQADFSSTNSIGQPSATHRRGFLNDSYDLQNPAKLFGWVRAAIRQAHQPNDGPPLTPISSPNSTGTGFVNLPL